MRAASGIQPCVPRTCSQRHRAMCAAYVQRWHREDYFLGRQGYSEQISNCSAGEQFEASCRQRSTNLEFMNCCRQDVRQLPFSEEILSHCGSILIQSFRVEISVSGGRSTENPAGDLLAMP